MDIDQRIEALTQSVELMAQMHQDNEKKYEERFAWYDQMLQRHEGLFERLVAIAENHERRIRDPEDGKDGQ